MPGISITSSCISPSHFHYSFEVPHFFRGLLPVSSIHMHAEGWTRVLILVLSLMDFILVNVSLKKVILFFISVLHLAPQGIVKPK